MAEMNIAELEEQFKTIQGKVCQQLVSKTGVQVLQLVSGYAKSLAHVDTGEMRNSIIPATARVDGDTVSYIVIAHAPHSVYEEYGNTRHGPHPFMRPAIGKEVEVDDPDNYHRPLDMNIVKKILAGAVAEVFEQ